MRRRWPWLVAWALLTLMAIAAFRGLAWDDALRALEGARVPWLAAAVLADAAILLAATGQWLRFLPPGHRVSFREMLWIITVTSTVSNGGPFLAGHATGIHLLATRGRTGHAAAVSVKAVEQLAEGIAKLSLVGAVVLLVPLPPALRAATFTLVVAVPALGLALLVAAHRGHVLERWGGRVTGWRGRALGFLSDVTRQLEAMRHPRRLGTGVGFALLKKVAEGLAIAAVLHALALDVPAWAVLLCLTTVNLSTMASVTPANLGIYEASALLAYHVAGMDPRAALGAAVLQHLCYLLPMAGLGWVALAWSGLRPAELPRSPDR